MLWAIEAPLNLGLAPTFTDYLYLSGTTFFTLGYGDLVPASSMGRMITVIEAANGFGLLAIVIGYLPVLYQAFSRREVNISLWTRAPAHRPARPKCCGVMRRAENSASLVLF